MIDTRPFLAISNLHNLKFDLDTEIQLKCFHFSSTATEKSQLLTSKFSDLLLSHVTEAIDSVSTQHM